MSTVRQHLQNLHSNLADHHQKKTEHHAKMASHFAKLAKHLGKTETTEVAKDSKGILEALANEHTEMSEHHAGQVEFHHAQVEACMKGMDSDLEKRANQLEPSPISRVTPTRPGIIPVPRAGQQPIAKANVPTEFQHLFEVEEVQ
jgi:hypothetical protein